MKTKRIHKIANMPAVSAGLVNAEITDPCFYRLLQSATPDEIFIAREFCDMNPAGNCTKRRVLNRLLDGYGSKK